MSIQKISHIGIAVKDWDSQMAFYRDVLGLELVQVEEIPERDVRVALFRVGESAIELLTPLSEHGPLAHFLKKRGEGLHHIAYAVESLSDIMTHLKAKGIDFVDETPRKGANEQQIAFLHPHSTLGVLTELCEEVSSTQTV